MINNVDSEKRTRMKVIEGTELGEKFEIAKLIEATKQVIQKLKIIFHHICSNPCNFKAFELQADLWWP